MYEGVNFGVFFMSIFRSFISFNDMEIIISYISKKRGGTVFCSFPNRAFLKNLIIRIFSYLTRLPFNLVASPFVKILCRLISDQFCLLISQIAFEISDMPATFMSKIVLVCYNR